MNGFRRLSGIMLATLSIALAMAVLAVGAAAVASAGSPGAADERARATLIAQTACKRPYRARTRDGRCVWSCGVGTRPHRQSGQCVCKRGYRQVGRDRFGRRVCRLTCRRPYHARTRDGRCVWSCGVGTRPHRQSGQCVCKRGYREVGRDRFGRRVCRRWGAGGRGKKPDLVIKQFGLKKWGKCQPYSAVITFQVTIKNIGSAPSPAIPAKALVGVRDQHPINWGNGKVIGAIPPGGSVTVLIPVYYLISNPTHMKTKAPHPFRAKADPLGLVGESNEGNNNSAVINVGEPKGC